MNNRRQQKFVHRIVRFTTLQSQQNTLNQPQPLTIKLIKNTLPPLTTLITLPFYLPNTNQQNFLFDKGKVEFLTSLGNSATNPVTITNGTPSKPLTHLLSSNYYGQELASGARPILALLGEAFRSFVIPSRSSHSTRLFLSKQQDVMLCSFM